MKHLLLVTGLAALASTIGVSATELNQVASWDFQDIRFLGSEVVSEGSPKMYIREAPMGDTETFILLNDNFQEVKRVCVPYKGLTSLRFYDLDFGDAERHCYLTQNVFNDDDNYEYVVSIMEDPNVISANVTGYKIVNENGELLMTITPPEGRKFYARLVKTDMGFYFVAEGSSNENKPISFIYKIDKASSSVQQVSSFTGRMDVSPRMAVNQTPVTVTLDENASYVSIDLIDMAGHIVQSIPVNDEKTISIDTSWLPRGVYIVKASGNEQSQETCKIIIR